LRHDQRRVSVSGGPVDYLSWTEQIQEFASRLSTGQGTDFPVVEATRLHHRIEAMNWKASAKNCPDGLLWNFIFKMADMPLAKQILTQENAKGRKGGARVGIELRHQD